MANIIGITLSLIGTVMTFIDVFNKKPPTFDDLEGVSERVKRAKSLILYGLALIIIGFMFQLYAAASNL